MDKSTYQANTVIILWSDHGYHHGEKFHIHKSTLWERSTRVPFIIAGKDISKGNINKAVNLIDIYPKVIDMLSLKNTKTGWPFPNVAFRRFKA